MTEPGSRARRMGVSRRAALAGVVAVLVAGGLAACQSEGFAEGELGTGEGGYIAGDGSWGVYPVGERKAPVVFSGTTASGSEVRSDALLGEVAVVNFWYAACPPCRLEARDLEALSQRHAPDGVEFVGVNIYDQAATVQSFNAEFGVTYDSILDVESGSVLAAFAGNVPPKAIPTTLVLDREGRVASYVLGVADPSILGTMISDVVAEPAG